MDRLIQIMLRNVCPAITALQSLAASQRRTIQSSIVANMLYAAPEHTVDSPRTSPSYSLLTTLTTLATPHTAHSTTDCSALQPYWLFSSMLNRHSYAHCSLHTVYHTSANALSCLCVVRRSLTTLHLRPANQLLSLLVQPSPLAVHAAMSVSISIQSHSRGDSGTDNEADEKTSPHRAETSKLLSSPRTPRAPSKGTDGPKLDDWRSVLSTQDALHMNDPDHEGQTRLTSPIPHKLLPMLRECISEEMYLPDQPPLPGVDATAHCPNATQKTCPCAPCRKRRYGKYLFYLDLPIPQTPKGLSYYRLEFSRNLLHMFLGSLGAIGAHDYFHVEVELSRVHRLAMNTMQRIYFPGRCAELKRRLLNKLSDTRGGPDGWQRRVDDEVTRKMGRPRQRVGYLVYRVLMPVVAVVGLSLSDIISLPSDQWKFKLALSIMALVVAVTVAIVAYRAWLHAYQFGIMYGRYCETAVESVTFFNLVLEEIHDHVNDVRPWPDTYLRVDAHNEDNRDNADWYAAKRQPALATEANPFSFKYRALLTNIKHSLWRYVEGDDIKLAFHVPSAAVPVADKDDESKDASVHSRSDDLVLDVDMKHSEGPSWAELRNEIANSKLSEFSDEDPSEREYNGDDFKVEDEKHAAIDDVDSMSRSLLQSTHAHNYRLDPTHVSHWPLSSGLSQSNGRVRPVDDVGRQRENDEEAVIRLLHNHRDRLRSMIQSYTEALDKVTMLNFDEQQLVVHKAYTEPMEFAANVFFYHNPAQYYSLLYDSFLYDRDVWEDDEKKFISVAELGSWVWCFLEKQLLPLLLAVLAGVGVLGLAEHMNWRLWLSVIGLLVVAALQSKHAYNDFNRTWIRFRRNRDLWTRRVIRLAYVYELVLRQTELHHRQPHLIPRWVPAI